MPASITQDERAALARKLQELSAGEVRVRPAQGGTGGGWPHRGDAPSMVVLDTRLARGASNGGFTFHLRCGGSGATTSSRCSDPSATPGAARWPTAGWDAAAHWEVVRE